MQRSCRMPSGGSGRITHHRIQIKPGRLTTSSGYSGGRSAETLVSRHNFRRASGKPSGTAEFDSCGTRATYLSRESEVIQIAICRSVGCGRGLLGLGPSACLGGPLLKDKGISCGMPRE